MHVRTQGVASCPELRVGGRLENFLLLSRIYLAEAALARSLNLNTAVLPDTTRQTLVSLACLQVLLSYSVCQV